MGHTVHSSGVIQYTRAKVGSYSTLEPRWGDTVHYSKGGVIQYTRVKMGSYSTLEPRWGHIVHCTGDRAQNIEYMYWV